MYLLGLITFLFAVLNYMMKVARTHSVVIDSKFKMAVKKAALGAQREVVAEEVVQDKKND